MPSRILFYFGVVMSLIYMGCGTFMLIGKRSVANMPILYQRILGSGFLIYGAFRFYRYYQQFKDYQTDTDAE